MALVPQLPDMEAYGAMGVTSTSTSTGTSMVNNSHQSSKNHKRSRSNRGDDSSSSSSSGDDSDNERTRRSTAGTDRRGGGRDRRKGSGSDNDKDNDDSDASDHDDNHDIARKKSSKLSKSSKPAPSSKRQRSSTSASDSDEPQPQPQVETPSTKSSKSGKDSKESKRSGSHVSAVSRRPRSPSPAASSSSLSSSATTSSSSSSLVTSSPTSSKAGTGKGVRGAKSAQLDKLKYASLEETVQCTFDMIRANWIQIFILGANSKSPNMKALHSTSLKTFISRTRGKCSELKGSEPEFTGPEYEILVKEINKYNSAREEKKAELAAHDENDKSDTDNENLTYLIKSVNEMLAATSSQSLAYLKVGPIHHSVNNYVLKLLESLVVNTDDQMSILRKVLKKNLQTKDAEAALEYREMVENLSRYLEEKAQKEKEKEKKPKKVKEGSKKASTKQPKKKKDKDEKENVNYPLLKKLYGALNEDLSKDVQIQQLKSQLAETKSNHSRLTLMDLMNSNHLFRAPWRVPNVRAQLITSYEFGPSQVSYLDTVVALPDDCKSNALLPSDLL